MKITQMLKREEFYKINKNTLSRFYANQTGESVLYIYPSLNAIVTAKPSKKVKKYLFCEYKVRGNFLKRVLVNSYVWVCLNSGGLLARRKCKVCAKISNDTLVYPCNKKYRIFDFSKNTVTVIGKYGFKTIDLNHEIEFRTKENLPNFVPGIITFSNNEYTEQIVDGMSLARVQYGYKDYKSTAYSMFNDFIKHTIKKENSKEYVNGLYEKINQLADDKIDRDIILKAALLLTKMATLSENVYVGLSHGDLQSGNIWIENKTKKIFIIDWESWANRSVFYDKAVLFDELRPGSIQSYLNKDIDITEKSVVLLEDIIYRLNEINSLPQDICQKSLGNYITKVCGWIEKCSR